MLARDVGLWVIGRAPLQGRTAPPRSLSSRLLLVAFSQIMLLQKLFGFRAEQSGGSHPSRGFSCRVVRGCEATVVVYFCFSYSCLGPRAEWNFIAENLF